MAERRSRVLLVSMPYGALERQALGLSLLKAGLTARGFDCDVAYLNLEFARYIGLSDYRWFTTDLPYTAFAGDWTFTESLYGADPQRERDYVRHVLQETWQLPEADVRRIQRIKHLATEFIRYCLAAVPWSAYGIVGFTSTFEQNIAALALARQVKSAHPDLRSVFGGANWEGEMGRALHERFEFVDVAVNGEADDVFPDLVARLLQAGSAGALTQIPGITYREQGRSVTNAPSPPMRDLDHLPLPDHSDYFAGLDRSGLTHEVYPVLLFESSRGCWWGAKSHCTFCGLNGRSMAFRRKSPERLLHEIRELTRTAPVHLLEAVDNILDMGYFSTVLPKLAQLEEPYEFFYEVKANLSRRHIKALAAARVTRIQPGIESMSDRILRIMRKGTTALQNIQMLKWCAEYGVHADWNLLYGFPGERREDYEAMLELFAAIRFLGPPTACGPIRVDRFSPYHEQPQALGLSNLRPMRVYRYLYPGREDDLPRIAYYFDYDYAASADPKDAAAPAIEYVREWRNAPEAGSLRSVLAADGGIHLVDTRKDRVRPLTRLYAAQRAIYEFLDRARSIGSIVKMLQQDPATRSIDSERVEAFVGTLVRHRLAVRDGDHALALALPEAEHQRWLEEREGRIGEPQGVEVLRIESSDVRPGDLAHA